MHTNALINEKSPYLRQHAHNPVEWLPWGETAFRKARDEDKPIFLSVGYSTCHWCHVMAHESFEDDRIAAVLNRDFVPIKIDREERPDVDRIYMLFVQASTGSGGWPMSVWLTPDLKPFYGGTYFPRNTRYGRPGFIDVLQHLSNAWKNDRQQIETASGSVLDQLRAMTGTARLTLEMNKDLFDSAYSHFRNSFDARWGGFGSAPKFPRPVILNYLLRYHAEHRDDHALEMVVDTLRGMARGGMHDQLGGGFHRYSVDAHWFVPHFEKMLYDQAQLAISYLEAHQITGEQSLAGVATGIFEYVLRDMTSDAGAFFSAEEADSPDPDNRAHSREGAFYVWTKTEIDRLLSGADSAPFSLRYGVETRGNVEEDPHGEFVGQNILFEARSAEEVATRLSMANDQASASLERARQLLFEARARRPRPHLDNKVLTSWNGLMISALVKGFVTLGEARYLGAAERAASFLLSTMYDESSGLLRRRFCDGDAAVPAFLDDYAFFAQALLDLFEATGKARYLELALHISRRSLRLFEDDAHGGFFSTTEQSPDLVLRVKDDYDGAEPSGNSVATDVLVRLSHLSGDEEFRTRAERSLLAFAPKIKAQPTIAPQLMVALGRYLAQPAQIVIRCAEATPALHELSAARRKAFAPWTVTLLLTDEESAKLQPIAPFLASLERKGAATLYECCNFTCELPQVLS